MRRRIWIAGSRVLSLVRTLAANLGGFGFAECYATILVGDLDGALDMVQRESIPIRPACRSDQRERATEVGVATGLSDKVVGLLAA